MKTFTYKSIYGIYENCYFETGRYENGNLAVKIMSNTEGPIAVVTVNPDIRLRDDAIAVKNYSENEGMSEWLAKKGLIELDPVDVIRTGFVEIPVYWLTDKGKRAFGVG